MIIILFVINLIKIYANKISEQVFQLYPTEGEFYQNHLSDFIKNEQLSCKMYPKVPNVQVINQCQEISQKQGNQFISMSSNNTHFGTLTYDNQVIIYEWKNQSIEQIGQSVPIDSSFNCFNINLSKDFSILIDCYYNNEFLLIQLIDVQSIITYSIQSYIPIQTKIQSIINGTNAFIVYAQYFQNYSILSLLSSSFYNLSSLNNYIIDFDIPITVSPNIYAITFQEIFQLSISSDSQFYYKYNFSQDDMINFNTISVYYDLSTYSQCEEIQLQYIKLLNSSSVLKIAQLLGCESEIIMVSNSCPFKSCEYIQNILSNNQFIIYQSINERCIYNKQEASKFYSDQINQSNSLLYINDDNELFQFNQEIFVFQISVPSIQINLINSTNSGKQYNFTVMCINYDKIYTLSLINIYLLILTNQDTNIYVISDNGFKDYEFSEEASGKFLFYGYSGQLLNYALTKNEIDFSVTQVTFYNVGEINQIYQLQQFLSINYPIQDERIYLIGYINQSLEILSCIYKYNNQPYEFTTLSSINISVNASTLQVAYSIYPSMIIIGLSTNDAIYLFQYYNDSNSLISYSNYTFEQQFSDFLVSYNSIIILNQQKQEINIMTFNFTNTFTLNQQSINKLFTNIEFNPIQIVMNTQLQSSLLYINNINEVIIISIDQNSFPIPISLIQVNFTIKQINLVNQQLILSYICNNQQNLCFQVWNVQHFPKYYYEKNLQSVNFDNNIIIQSDNLFFYVTFSNYNVYVYNPLLPYHMTLYYMLELTSPFQCAQSSQLRKGFIYEKSIIISKNNVYLLYGQQNFNLTYQYDNQFFNNSIIYPQLTYNYTVTSALNDTAFQLTPNQTVTFYSNFTVFQQQTNINITLSNNTIIPHSKNFTYPMNLILDRQVGYCGSTNKNQTYDLNKYCSLTQFSNQSIGILNIQNYSLITSINNEFFALQNNFNIQTINSDLNNISNFNYQNLNLSECLLSTSSDYSLYSICQNSTSQYLLNFTLNFQGKILNLNTTQLPQSFQNISKIKQRSFYFNDTNNKLYWLNQSNNRFQLIVSCSDFSNEQIQNNKFSSQQIIIFYVQQSQYIYYQIMSIDNQDIILKDFNFIIIMLCTLQSSCSQYLSQLNTILILQIFYNKTIILVSDMYFSYIIQISLLYQSQNNLYQGLITGTIPNYGNLNNTGNSYYKNGVLMQQFSIFNKGQYVVGVYYINNLLDGNLTTPILMQGLFNTTNTNYAMIVDLEYQNGTSLYIYNQSIYNYSISTWNITCHLKGNGQKELNVSIFCSNQFSNGTYYIKFKQPQIEKASRRWIYALISIIALLLFIFYIKVKEKTRNLNYNTIEIEL